MNIYEENRKAAGLYYNFCVECSAVGLPVMIFDLEVDCDEDEVWLYAISTNRAKPLKIHEEAFLYNEQEIGQYLESVAGEFHGTE